MAVRRTGRRGSSPGRWAACSSVAEEDGRGQDHPVNLQLVDLVEADGLRGLGRLCTASAPRGRPPRCVAIGSCDWLMIRSANTDSLTPKYTFSIWVLSVLALHQTPLHDQNIRFKMKPGNPSTYYIIHVHPMYIMYHHSHLVLILGTHVRPASVWQHLLVVAANAW